MQNTPTTNKTGNNKPFIVLLIAIAIVVAILKSLPNNEAGAAVVIMLMLIGGPTFLIVIAAHKITKPKDTRNNKPIKTTTLARFLTILVGTILVSFTILILVTYFNNHRGY